MHGVHPTFRTLRRVRQHHRRHRQVRHGRRLAAVRAFTAATLYLENRRPSLTAAAECCGSNPQYVEALVTLIKSENTSLLKEVLAGRVVVLAAAKQTKRLAKLVAAYRTASVSDRVAFAKAVGPTTLFDNTLAPAL
jgi:aminoglycoside phosphotransferase family enzyme